MASTRSGGFFDGGLTLNVDMGDVTRQIDMLRGIMSQRNFEALMYRTFGEAGRRSRTIISQEAARDYAVARRYIAQSVGRYELTFGGAAPVTCRIPLSAVKGTIGGRFRLRRPATIARTGNITADIVRSGTSTLPRNMPARLGGQQPFVGRGRLNGVVFARRGRGRWPIIRVVGVASPQMPLNRSEEHIQEALLEFVGQRLEHNFEHMMGNGR